MYVLEYSQYDTYEHRITFLPLLTRVIITFMQSKMTNKNGIKQGSDLGPKY